MTIVEKVKKILDVRSDELQVEDLFRLLEKKRNKFHPDLTTDPDVKDEYDSKFKEYGQLLEKLKEEIQNKPISSQQDLIQYERNLEYFTVKESNQQFKDQISGLESELRIKESEVERLQEEINSLKDKKVEEEKEKLLNLFKPKKSNFIALGISGFLVLLLNILLQVEKIAGVFTRNLPFLDVYTLNLITTSLLVIISFVILQNFIGQSIVKNWSKRVTTVKFYNDLFHSELSLEKANRYRSELLGLLKTINESYFDPQEYSEAIKKLKDKERISSSTRDWISHLIESRKSRDINPDESEGFWIRTKNFSRVFGAIELTEVLHYYLHCSFSERHFVFPESAISHFIERKLSARKLVLFRPNSGFALIFSTYNVLLTRRLFGIDEEIVFDNLKNIMIYDLLTRETIKPNGNIGLEKLFQINDYSLTSTKLHRLRNKYSSVADF
ncbi:MAG: hypothetical protein Roseis2KO_49150 [Roseivirga sp.]